MSKAEIPQPSTLYRLVGIAGILLAHSLALMFVMFVLVKIVPPYAMFFAEQGIELPGAAMQMIMWSEFWVAYWFLLFPLLMAIDAAVVCALGLAASGRKRILSAYSHLCLLAACTLVVYVSALLCVAVYGLVE